MWRFKFISLMCKLAFFQNPLTSHIDQFLLSPIFWDTHGGSVCRTRMNIEQISLFPSIMVPILQKWFAWRPFIIRNMIFLNGTIFLYWAQTKHIFLNETVLFYIEHRFPRRTFNRLIKLIMPTAYPLSRSPYISPSRFYIPFIVRSKQEWK